MPTPIGPSVALPDSAAATVRPVPAQVELAERPALRAPAGVATTVPAPAEGVRLMVEVEPGARINLADPAFDPDTARYGVDGQDLVVTTAEAGVVILDGFFAPGPDPALLSVVDGPVLAADVLLQRAIVVAEGTIIEEPAGRPVSTPGNANFAPYDPGDIGTGPEPTGPLLPTDLGFGLPDLELDNRPDLGGGDDGGVGQLGPTLGFSGSVTGFIVPEPRGFNPPGTPQLPVIGERRPLADSEVNGLPKTFVTLDATREVIVSFVDETAALKSSLGAFTVAPDGTIANVQIVFPNVNDFTARATWDDGAGPLNPGDSVSLGTFEAGTTLGFFYLQGGWDQFGDELTKPGTFEVRNGVRPAELANINDFDGRDQGKFPFLVRVNPDGSETVLAARLFFSSDASDSTPNNNRLNPDNLGHFVHGYDPETGRILFGVEDVQGPLGNRSDRDFNDGVFAFAPDDTFGDAIFVGNQEGRLGPTITDPDSTEIGSATVRIATGARPGDILRLTGFADLDGDGILDGTDVQVTRVSPTELRFEGIGSIALYEQILDGIRFGSTATSPEAGIRLIEGRVFDSDGNGSNFATVPIVIESDIIRMTSPNFTGSDRSEAVIGTTGDDIILGGAGDDFIYGGRGNDRIFGGEGDDVIIPGSGRDVITAGPGADTVFITGLSDGRNVWDDFNAFDGDKLDLTRLFQGTAFDPRAPNASQFLRFENRTLDGVGVNNDIAVIVDLDGPGAAYSPQVVMELWNPVGPIGGDPIAKFTTFNQASDGATV
jgi:Ca2+-binding RTX toxin-like protein